MYYALCGACINIIRYFIFAMWIWIYIKYMYMHMSEVNIGRIQHIRNINTKIHTYAERIYRLGYIFAKMIYLWRLFRFIRPTQNF